ncbi:MAG: sugar ABC transporter permease, partial [Chloroflexi bacterium]|nr:sugar ABC transporter permease [Chloroflexota bacterium]
MSHELSVRPGSQVSVKRKASARVIEERLGWVLVAPAVLVVLGMVAYPFLDAVRISFTDKMIGMGPGRYVGLRNYAYVLGWPQFGQMVIRTVAFTVAAVFLKTVVGLVVASSLTQDFRGRNVLRGIFMLPWILPTYIIVLVWRWIFDGQTGVLNQILVSWGILRSNQPWLAQAPTAIGALIFVLVWKGYPFYGLTFLAAMQ